MRGLLAASVAVIGVGAVGAHAFADPHNRSVIVVEPYADDRAYSTPFVPQEHLSTPFLSAGMPPKEWGIFLAQTGRQKRTKKSAKK